MAAHNSLKKQQASIAKQIAQLQRKQEILRKNSRAPVIARIVEQMREYEISAEELADAYKTSTRDRPMHRNIKARVSSKPRAAVPVKYKHPKTGETWTGRGKAPRWLTAEETAGTPRENFLIDVTQNTR